MKNPILFKGMKFPNGKVFRKVLREYVVKKHMNIKFNLNEKNKISVYCKNEYGWKVYASTITSESTFWINTLFPNCTYGRTFKNNQCTSTYVAKKCLDDFNKNDKWSVEAIQHHVTKHLVVDISVNQVYRAKQMPRSFLRGNDAMQYTWLRDYAKIIHITDIGSKVIIQIEMDDENSQPRFKRMYVRYNAQKVGFLIGCRALIGLDGCHLKGRFGGQLLSATRKGGNDNIFSIALVVVEQENKES